MMTRAATGAIRECLERVRRQRTPDATVADLLVIGRRCAGTLKDKPVDHDDLRSLQQLGLL